MVTGDRRTPAEVEFATWLDSVAVDTTAWRHRDPVTSDAPMRRFLRRERYRQKWLQDQDWYRRSQDRYRRLMNTEEDQLSLFDKEVIEDAGTPGFWEQF
jgi:hypothetical protein